MVEWPRERQRSQWTWKVRSFRNAHRHTPRNPIKSPLDNALHRESRRHPQPFIRPRSCLQLSSRSPTRPSRTIHSEPSLLKSMRWQRDMAHAKLLSSTRRNSSWSTTACANSAPRITWMRSQVSSEAASTIRSARSHQSGSSVSINTSAHSLGVDGTIVESLRLRQFRS